MYEPAFLAGLAVVGGGLVALAQTAARPAVYLSLAVPIASALALYSRRDAVTVLGIFLAMLFLVPSRFAFTMFSQAITPSLVVGLLALWLWACLLIVPNLGLSVGPQPVRVVILFLLWSAGISWALAFARPLPAIESRQAVIGYLALASACGISLLAADGIHGRDRLDTLLRWLVVGATFVAVVGIVQFATGFDISRYLRPPQLSTTDAGDTFIDARSSLRRVQGTTEHPIELGVLLTVALPLAVHYARCYAGPSRWRAAGWWACAGLLLVTVPLTLSRTAVVGLATGLLVLLPFWPGRHRLVAITALAGLTALIRLTIPGLVGTLISLFTGIESDPSITGRTGHATAAGPYILDAPWFGRGLHTFLHSYYFVIDNQYISSLVETGLVGLVALVAVFLTGAVLALLARRLSQNPIDRDLAHSLAASMLVAGVSYFTFDALSFPTATGVPFLLFGCAGALWRLARKEAALRATQTPVRPVP